MTNDLRLQITGNDIPDGNADVDVEIGFLKGGDCFLEKILFTLHLHQHSHQTIFLFIDFFYFFQIININFEIINNVFHWH